MAKIWKNRIIAGTQKFSDCPSRYKADVTALIRKSLEEGSVAKADLQRLVTENMLYAEEYRLLTGEEYKAE